MYETVIGQEVPFDSSARIVDKPTTLARKSCLSGILDAEMQMNRIRIGDLGDCDGIVSLLTHYGLPVADLVPEPPVGIRLLVAEDKAEKRLIYNVQVAVEARHHLIVAHEVTNSGHDRAQLSPMAQAARDSMCKRRLKVIADRGYYSGPQINDLAPVSRIP